MNSNKSAALVLLVLTAALLVQGCASGEAATFDVTYYYLPG